MRAVFLLILMSVFTGCVRYVTYTVNEPPRIVLDRGQSDILFISRVDSSSFDFNQEKKTEVFREGYSRLVSGIMEGFNGADIRITWLDTVPFKLPPQRIFISRDTIRMICDHNASSMLLVMEDFNMERNKQVNVEVADDGSKDREATFTVRATVHMSLYARNGSLIDGAVLEDERLLASRSVLSGVLAIGPSLGNRSKEIYPMLEQLGRNYAEDFKSHLVEKREMYFAHGAFKPVRNILEKRDWVTARDFLQSVYDNTENIRTKRQAAYNLYVVNFLLDDRQSAMKWKDESGY